MENEQNRALSHHLTPGGGGELLTQIWVITVKLIKKAVAVNLHKSLYRRSGHTTIAHHLEDDSFS